jgi:protein involved in sex pheromone biosynthesis
MRGIEFASKRSVALAVVATMLLSACSINVKKKDDGDDKQVDINSPIGGIHVSKQATAEDTGLPVYPGARLKEKGSDGDNKSANVNISGFGYGLRVVALEYESNDTTDKIIAYYKDQLKRYGTVLVCHTKDFDANMDLKDSDHEGSHPLTCEGSSGNNIELKVGTKENQHLVSIKQEGKGSSFALVFIRTHGKDADI